MTVQVQVVEEQRPLSKEARRRLGRAYAFLMSLRPKEAPDTVEAARPGVSEAEGETAQEADNTQGL